MRIYRAIAIIAAVAATSALAADFEFAPREYIPEGGTGWLRIDKADRDGAIPFEIEAYGTNGHTCNLDGRIVRGVASLETDESKAHCVVAFRAVAGGIEVASKSGPCHFFCGVRAHFDDTYLVPAAGCDGASREAAQKKFQALYDRKRYAQALAVLAPLAKACDKTLHWGERGRVANDLAITQYKLGMRAQCLKALAPYAEDAARSDDDVLEEWGYAPSDAEGYLSIVKAARFNLNLCRKK